MYNIWQQLEALKSSASSTGTAQRTSGSTDFVDPEEISLNPMSCAGSDMPYIIVPKFPVFTSLNKEQRY